MTSIEVWRLQNAEEIPKQINPTRKPKSLRIALDNVFLILNFTINQSTLHSIKNAARNEMESGFKKGMSKSKSTLFNRDGDPDAWRDGFVESTVQVASDATEPVIEMGTITIFQDVFPEN